VANEEIIGNGDFEGSWLRGFVMFCLMEVKEGSVDVDGSSTAAAVSTE
jgi:hypothetical protein